MARLDDSFAETLYEILPAVYRTRDNGDLKHYLAGCADLLDAVYATLQQKAADSFPDKPSEISPHGPCQDWLLPYFAELLDTRLVSPLPDGQRDEIAHTVRWRQGKGTLSVIEAVIEAIGQTEAVIHEGWRRVATTPRLDKPLQPATTLGYAREPEAANPGSAARHPDLPAVTLDFRCPSRAVSTDEDNAGMQSITIDGVRRLWRQASLHGAPCFPGSYEDLSRRTVDFRLPDWRVGHFHPSTVLAFLPPPSGFFPPGATSVAWSEPPDPALRALIEIDVSDPARTVYRNRSLTRKPFRPVRVTGPVALGTPPGHAGDPDTHIWRFEGLVFDGAIEAFDGRLEFARCAVSEVFSHAADRTAPTIAASDSLIGRLRNPRGLTRLSYCTLLDQVLSESVEASDCIFLGTIRKDHETIRPPESGCLRFTRIAPAQAEGGMTLHEVSRAPVHLFEAVFGRRHCGVLHPASHPKVLGGAEDGGELGAYHHQFHHLAYQAVLLKLQDFLPVGLEPALTYDPRLLVGPFG